MPQKSKCSPEEKVKAVEDYLTGTMSRGQILQIYRINKETLKNWVCLYKSSGKDDLIPQAVNKHYPIELKDQVVKEYLDGNTSVMKLLIKYSISDKCVVHRWIKKYNSHGEFKSKKTGIEIYMTKGRTTNFEERQKIVADCLSNQKDYRATMERYGVSYAQIYSWVKKYEKNGVASLADRRGKSKPGESMSESDMLRAENRMLRAQLKEKEMENDVIKKFIELERRWF